MLFDRPGTDRSYELLRNAEREQPRIIRDFYESRWAEFEAFAEPDFLRNIGLSFEEAAWELEVGASLARRGLLRQRQLGRGPDFVGGWGEQVVFVEATCPGPGDEANPDRLPEEEPVDISRAKPRVYVPAINRAILRCTSSIDAKVRQYRAFKQSPRGQATDDAGLIVALSGRRISAHAAHLIHPLPLRFLYGAGDLAIDIDVATGEAKRQYLEYRPVQLRVEGVQIDSSLFVTDLYPELVGVIWDPGFGYIERRWERAWTFFPKPGLTVPPEYDWLAQVRVDLDGTVHGID